MTQHECHRSGEPYCPYEGDIKDAKECVYREHGYICPYVKEESKQPFVYRNAMVDDHYYDVE